MMMALPDNGDFAQSGSIISRWKLDESSGTREDSVGSNDLTDNNTVTGATGKFGDGASAFARASTEYLSISDNASLSPVGDISYFAWIKPTTTPSDAAYVIASKYETSDRSWYFDYSEDGGGERLHFYVEDSNGDSTSPEVAVTLANDTWHYVGFVYDVSAFEVKFYVNGAQVGATGSTAGVNDLEDSAIPFFIGAIDLGSGATTTWDGDMQDHIFWNVELTAAEVAANYNLYGTGLPATAALPQSGSLIGRWKLDEPSGTRVDSVGSNDLSDNNTVTAGGEQFNNIAANFEVGNDEYLSASDSAALSPTGDTSYFAWIKLESQPPAGNHRFIASKYDGGDRSWFFSVREESGNFLNLYIEDSNEDGGQFNVSYTFANDVWYHVGWVYDQSEADATFYVNGKMAGSPVSLTNVDDLEDSSCDFRIGEIDSVGAAGFDGLMQDHCWWNVELTAAEVEDLYNAYFNLPDEGDLPQPGSVVARHTLTEGGGTRNDQVGTNHLTDNNTVTSTTGISETNSSAERAADFNDSNSEYLTVADNANISITGDMSWFAWVRPDTALQGSSDSYFLASKYDHTQRSWYIAYALEDTNEQVDVYIADNLTGDANSKREIWDVTLAIGQWYHMGFVYDASDGEVGFYIDGAQVDTIRTGFATDIVDGTAAYRIGAFSGGGGTTGFWPGQVQDAIMWNAELTGAEVTTLYELYTVEPSTGTPSGLTLMGVGN